jgi:hypothetical protein
MVYNFNFQMERAAFLEIHIKSTTLPTPTGNDIAEAIFSAKP